MDDLAFVSSPSPPTAASCDLRVRNGVVAWRHITSEYADVVDDIIDTLAPCEPFAYTVPPMPTGDGSIPHQVILSTREQIRAAYHNLHRFTQVRSLQPVTELRGDWYVFIHGLGEGLLKSTGQTMVAPTIVMFPTMGMDGITGELIWTRSATGAPYTGHMEGPLSAERAIIARHDDLLDCLRRGDAEGVAALAHAGAQTAIRDYVADTAALTELHSAAELKAHLDSFFARFKVLDIGVVNRTAGDWFVFAELLWVVEDRQAAGGSWTFTTAEHAEVRPDGLFAARIGHGTPLQPA